MANKHHAGWLLLPAFVAGHLALKYATGPHEAFRPLPAWNFGQQTERVLDAELASTLALRDEAGAPTTLGEQATKAQLLVVAFSESWCPPCVAELPELQRLQDTHAAAGLRVIVVYANSNPLQMQQLRKRLELRLPLFAAPGGTQALGVRAVPTLVVLDNAAKVVYQHEGRDAGLGRLVATRLARGAEGPR